MSIILRNLDDEVFFEILMSLAFNSGTGNLRQEINYEKMRNKPPLDIIIFN